MTASELKSDVLLLGAGAAGLAAAAQLCARGRTICVLEARDRIGGRIWTRHDPDLKVPLELGAEFIHGLAPVTFEWLRKSGVPTIDATESRRVTLRNGKPQRSDDLFAEMKRGLRKVKRPKQDMPFSVYLDTVARSALSPRARKFARMLAEGYDAADATRASTFEILNEWSGQSAADSETFRPLGGYGELVRSLADSLDPQFVQTRLNAVVHEVRWEPGHVFIEGLLHGKPFTASAKQAIVTLPLGVLQLPEQTPGAVRFSPTLSAKRTAFDGLAVSPVVKVVLRFRTAFWEELQDGRYRDTAFFHAAESAFPTFWSTLPMRTSVLNAWVGGPNAVRLAGLSEAEVVGRALESLETIFGKAAKVERRLQGACWHDWQADPYSRGAYSYVTVGGSKARRALAKPLRDTLFFAGEATDYEGEAGTVAGALQSGRRAALRAIAKK